ncbi:MAG: HEPN domain-containing protein [Bacteroidetes bacterium]|nr:HEPN domain-containing protein [Bacteroidota bacterium]
MDGLKEDYIEYRIAKSKEVFEDAKLLALNSRWNSCINRLYYSSFYIISALLYKASIKADTHNGIKTQFFQHYVKSNLVDAEHGKLYVHLFQWRQKSDYADFIEFDEETVNPLIEKVEVFNKTVLEILRSIN